MKSAASGRLIAGRYRLSATIARGGMGVVWRARDELLSRDVAVKELAWPAYFSAAEQRAACRRATREARLAARLNHPNVVRVFDIIEEDGCPWIVMEFLPYRSLRDLVREEGPLSPRQAAEAGLGILAALRAAHAEGIVHRDIKPANILMGPDRVVVTDFGIARATGTSLATTTLGVLIGSPSYIAPERAREGQSGPPGDLWGLGASLYAAVEGHGPFDRDGGALASLTAVVADQPEPATHAGPLWPVISGLLCKDPDKRLNAAEAERMLRRVATSPAVPATAVTSRPRRSRGPAAAFARLAALAVIVTSGTAAGLALTSAPRHEAASAAPIASSAAGPHPSGAGTHPSTPAQTHVPARTSQVRPSPSTPRSIPVTASTRAGNGAGAQGGPAVQVHRARHARHPPGRHHGPPHK